MDRAEEKMKTSVDPLQMFEHAYEEMPPYLKEQREELAEEQAEAGKEANHG